MNEIKIKVNRKAEKVVEAMGWTVNYSHKTVQGLNFPYAISFGTQRKLMNIKLLRHPKTSYLKTDQTAIRMVLPIESSVEYIVKQIETRLLPRVRVWTNKKDNTPLW
jgi:hypothetical protein